MGVAFQGVQCFAFTGGLQQLGLHPHDGFATASSRASAAATITPHAVQQFARGASYQGVTGFTGFFAM
jgi:hypothetical protein